MLSAANQFSAACIMNTRWQLLAPDSIFADNSGRTPVERCGTTACQTANLQHFAWRSDCSGLFHTPIVDGG
jgi:hypothetical protein